MSSNNDELDKLRFKFYVNRGYYPNDSELKRLENQNHKKNKNIHVQTIVSSNVITNEEDEHTIFINEIKKLNVKKEHSDSSKQDNKKQKDIKRKLRETDNDVSNITIPNYEAQREEFLFAVKNQSYSYRSKNDSVKINKVRTFKKSDIVKAVPKQTIDLHGMTRDKAYMYIKESVEEALVNKESPILVIHGKGLHNELGRSIVKESLDEYIVKDNKDVIEYYHRAPKHLGGSGATLLYLKI